MPGSATIPDLPPPCGSPTTALFTVMARARRATSLAVTSDLIRTPPIAGPRATLSMTTTASTPSQGLRKTTFAGPSPSTAQLADVSAITATRLTTLARQTGPPYTSRLRSRAAAPKGRRSPDRSLDPQATAGQSARRAPGKQHYLSPGVSLLQLGVRVLHLLQGIGPGDRHGQLAGRDQGGQLGQDSGRILDRGEPVHLGAGPLRRLPVDDRLDPVGGHAQL